MKISISSKDPFSLYHHLLVYFCEEGTSPVSVFKGQPSEITDFLSEAVRRQRFKGEAGKELLIPATGAQKTPQVLLVGLGKAGELTGEKIRAAAAKAAVQARRTGAERVGVLCPAPGKKNPAEAYGQAVGEGFALGIYKFDKYKSPPPGEPTPKVREVLCYPDASGKDANAWGAGLKIGEAIGRGANTARDLSNAPGNEMPPSKIAQEAQRIARLGKFPCKVLGPAEIKQEKMGGILAVAQGSDQPPRVVVLEYKGARKKSDPPVIVVGKGVSFDSGGISLKPPQSMDEMKHDMSGAAAVIGLFDALRDLKPKVNVIGICACAENMPSGKAYRPGDVVVTRSKKTVEILNTDAEGRMCLADALDYAGKFKPKAIIDLATLTGACVIALGNAAAGLMTNDDSLRDKLLAAAEESGERVWQLPLYEEYTKQVKSQIADLKNTGGREGGTVTAGAFLKEFVPEKTPWAHVDIAGTAWFTKPQGYLGRGATGYGVRLLAHYLLAISK